MYDSAKKVSYFEQAFAIEAKIGAGCFGNVYRVKSKEDGKLYAVSINHTCSILNRSFLGLIFLCGLCMLLQSL